VTFDRSKTATAARVRNEALPSRSPLNSHVGVSDRGRDPGQSSRTLTSSEARGTGSVRACEQAVTKAEGHGVYADADRERSDHDRADGGRSAQHPQRIPRVLPCVIDQPDRACFAMVLFDPVDPAQPPPCNDPGVVGCDAAPRQLVRDQRLVRGQLAIDVLVRPADANRVQQPQNRPPHRREYSTLHSSEAPRPDHATDFT